MLCCPYTARVSRKELKQACAQSARNAIDSWQVQRSSGSRHADGELPTDRRNGADHSPDSCAGDAADTAKPDAKAERLLCFGTAAAYIAAADHAANDAHGKSGDEPDDGVVSEVSSTTLRPPRGHREQPRRRRNEALRWPHGRNAEHELVNARRRAARRERGLLDRPSLCAE